MLLVLHRALEVQLERDLEAVRRGEPGAAFRLASLRGHGRSRGDALVSGCFAALCARFEGLWPYLTDGFKEKVRSQLGVAEGDQGVRVGIVPDTDDALDVTAELPPPEDFNL